MQIPFYYVHYTTIIDRDVEIGIGSEIWHFCHISSGAKVGKNCTLGDHVYVGNNVEIGNGCKIQNNVFIPTGVIIADNVFVGPSVTFTNIVVPRAFISRKKEYKTTIINEGASIGANTVLLSGISVGKYAMIGAGSVVTKSVYDYQVVFGNPAKLRGRISVDGDEITYYTEYEENRNAL